jgi:hypothetical protein
MIPDIPELEDYGLDFETGFMPQEQPLHRLADPYYGSWEEIMDRFNGLVLVGRLREAVNQVPPKTRRDLTPLVTGALGIVLRDDSRKEKGICHSFVFSAWIRMERPCPT